MCHGSPSIFPDDDVVGRSGHPTLGLWGVSTVVFATKSCHGAQPLNGPVCQARDDLRTISSKSKSSLTIVLSPSASTFPSTRISTARFAMDCVGCRMED